MFGKRVRKKDRMRQWDYGRPYKASTAKSNIATTRQHDGGAKKRNRRMLPSTFNTATANDQLELQQIIITKQLQWKEKCSKQRASPHLCSYCNTVWKGFVIFLSISFLAWFLLFACVLLCSPFVIIVVVCWCSFFCQLVVYRLVFVHCVLSYGLFHLVLFSIVCNLSFAFGLLLNFWQAICMKVSEWEFKWKK